MANQRHGVLGNVVRDLTRPNGELADDQVDAESRGIPDWLNSVPEGPLRSGKLTGNSEKLGQDADVMAIQASLVIEYLEDRRHRNPDLFSQF